MAELSFPYYPISAFYKKKFGHRVYKLPVSVAETCPNREGLKGMKTCIFCDEWGSAAYPKARHLDIVEQIERNKKQMTRGAREKKYLVYFQAYTNTYLKVERMKEYFRQALDQEGIMGLVVGTRPDCISQALFDLWNEYAEKTFLAVELGVQSFDNKQLEWMRRGHTSERSIKAIYRIKEKCPKVDLGVHLMFGLPGETDEDLVEAAHICSELPIDNVKLHNLHVLKDTPLEEEYLKGDFTPLERKDYADRAILFLQHLRDDIAVHRLTAVASRHDELVAPDWVRSKLESYQFMLDEMNARGAQQGQKHQPLDTPFIAKAFPDLQTFSAR